MVRSIGANRVIDYKQEDFTKGAERYDVILDCIGNHSLSAIRRVLKPKGIMVGGPVGRWIKPFPRVIHALILSMFVSQKISMIIAKRSQQDLTILGDLMASGKMTPVIDRRYSLSEVGPDLLSADFDAVEALRRVKEHGDEEIANVLLNQRVMAGIGNIWKSEALFRSGVDPFARVRDLDDATLERIIANAKKLLLAGANGRVDRMVYSRGGQPCRKCGTRIGHRAQGPDARLTYWCPKCQPTSASSSSR